MPRRGTAAGELQAVDPDTGEPLTRTTDLASDTTKSRRRTRLRVGAVLLALLASICAVAATYRGINLVGVRAIESSWSRAVAVDALRAETDDRIRDTLEHFADPSSAAGRDARGIVGPAEAARLGDLSHRLRGVVVADARLRDLRDDMIRELAIRRLQLAPDRQEIGTSRLRELTTRLHSQLRRYDLRPRAAPDDAALRGSARAAMSRVTAFADHRTDTLLACAVDDGLALIDIDANRVRRIPLPGAVTVLAARGDTVLTVGSGVVQARSLATGALAWEQPGYAAFFSNRDGATMVVHDRTATRVDGGGTVTSVSSRLPAGRVAVGLTDAGLVLAGAEEQVGPIEIFGEGAAATRTVTAQGRFVAASNRFVAWQDDGANGPRLHTTPATLVGDASVRLPRTDAGRGAFSPDEQLLATPGGPVAGARAAMLLHTRTGNQLVALGPPATSFSRASVTWSPDGLDLFWRTQDDRIAIHRIGSERPEVVRVDLRGVSTCGAAPRAR